MRRFITAVAICVLGFGSPAIARTWLVGPDQAVKTPSEAARKARDGDLVRLEAVPGGYYNCAVWGQNNLTIEGIGEDVRITDTTCRGKALFVIEGSDVTIRNFTFARARVADGNGAGIRAEGHNLRIEHSRFVNNEVGILAGDQPGATLAIVDSEFLANGSCRRGCTDALSVDALAKLRVENSVFKNNRGRGAIRSRAALTELVGNDIVEGDADATGYLVELPSGGSLLMQRNSIERHKGPANVNAAVFAAAGYGAQPVRELVLRDNTAVVNPSDGSGSLFFLNWTDRNPVLTGNRVSDGMVLVSSGGYHAFLARSYLREFIGTLRQLTHRILSVAAHHVRTALGL